MRVMKEGFPDDFSSIVWWQHWYNAPSKAINNNAVTKGMA